MGQNEIKSSQDSNNKNQNQKNKKLILPTPFKPPKIKNYYLLCLECELNIIPFEFQIVNIKYCRMCYEKDKKKHFEWYLNAAENPKDCSTIIENELYLGGMGFAKCKEILKEKNIKNILCVGYMLFDLYPDDFNYKIIEIEDDENEYILPYLYPALLFMSSNKTFVHCQMGISRSSSFVIAYIMMKYRMKYKEAFEYVKNKREFIYPNDGFVEQLEQFQEILEVCDYKIKFLREIHRGLFFGNDF